MSDYLRKMMSGSNSVSFGRNAAGLIIFVWLVICTILSCTTAKVVDIPVQWAGLAVLLFGTTKLAKQPTPKEEEDV